MRPRLRNRFPRFAILPLLAWALAAGTSAGWAGEIVILDEQQKPSKPSPDSDDDQVKMDVTIEVPDGDIDSLIEMGRKVHVNLGRHEAIFDRQLRDLESRRGGRRTSEVVSFGKNVRVERDQIVEGDVVSMLGSATIEGVVQGSVVSLGGEVRLGEEAIIHGDAVSVAGGGIYVMPGSVITGEAVAIGGRIEGDEDAHIGDRVELKFIPSAGARTGMGARDWLLLFLLTLHLIFIGLIGWILVKLAGRRWANGAVTLRSRGWESLLAGIGAGIVFAIVGIPLLVVIILALIALVVGIPLVPLVAFLLLIFPLPGYLITSLVIGGALQGRASSLEDPVQEGVGTTYLLGHLLLSLPWILMVPVSMIPGLARLAFLLLLLGWGIISLAVAFGWGAFLLSRFGSRFPRQAVSPAPGMDPGMAPPVS
ncbi:MAG: polymer-forming cytoskeletal protein [Candidatus Eisenbacteria bacterium]